MRRFLFGILVMCIGYMAFGQEGISVSSSVSASRIGYQRERLISDVTYPSGIRISGNAEFTYPISDTLLVSGSIASDPILKETASATIGYWSPKYTAQIGPLIGISVLDASTFNAGLAASGRAEIAGKFFIEAMGSYGLGFNGVRRADAGTTIGWYIPQAVTALTWTWESFTSAGTLGPVVDRREWYEISMNIFQKYVPYRVKLGLAYQRIEKKFVTETIEHNLQSLIFQVGAEIPIRGYITAIAGLQSSVFTFGVADDTFLAIPSTGFNAYLFDVTLGAKVEIQ